MTRSGAVGGRRPRHKAKGVEVLFRAAERLGARIEMCRSGHWKVWAPGATRPVSVASTNRDPNLPKMIARDLRRAGLDV